MTIVADTTPEDNETLKLGLTGPPSAVLHDWDGLGTILNDDAVPPPQAPAPVPPGPDLQAPVSQPRPGAAVTPSRMSTSVPASPNTSTAASPAESPSPTESPEPTESPDALISPPPSAGSDEPGRAVPILVAGVGLAALAGLGGWGYLHFVKGRGV